MHPKENKWKLSPTPLSNKVLKEVDNIIAIDETGTPTLKNIDNNTPVSKTWFGITGIIIDKTTINGIAKDVMDLKEKYWQNGNYNGQRVVFHSRNIRKKEGSFNPKLINYDDFRNDLNELLSSLPIQVVATLINKKKHVNKYLYPYPVYSLSLEFLIERASYRLNWLGESTILLLESRGWREDCALLRQINSILKNGSRYVSPDTLKCIKGIYFAKKRTSNRLKSYWPLELSDMISYRIYSTKTQNKGLKDFDSIEKLFIDYPNYQNKGLKFFP